MPRSIVNITEITMVHIRRNRTGSDYEPVVNLYPLGSLSYPSPGLPKPLSRFTVVAGESYKIAGSFTELALLRDPLDNTAYALQDFINVRLSYHIASVACIAPWGSLSPWPHDHAMMGLAYQSFQEVWSHHVSMQQTTAITSPIQYIVASTPARHCQL